MASREEEVRAQLADLSAASVPLLAELEEIKKSHRWECPSCGKTVKAKKLEVIRSHYYEEPHGCTGGDRWHFGNWVIPCPKCGEEQRIHEKTRYMPAAAYPRGDGAALVQWIAAHRRLFKSITDRHKR